MVKFVLLALVLVAESVAFAIRPAHADTIRGDVRRLDETTPIVGATVLALREGVLVAGSATSDANGQFIIEGLRPDIYDVHAGKEGFVSETKIDVSVAGPDALVTFNLATPNELLSQQGIPPELFVDTDSDGVPDFRERQVGSNPMAADSNGDGIPDAVELISGVLPTHGPLDSDDKPEIISPEAGDNLPIPPFGVRPPVPIVFHPVPGGTRYEIALSSDLNNTVQVADFMLGDLQLGPRGMALLTLPADITAGAYSLTVRAFHGAEPLGQRSDPVTLTLVETVPVAFAPSSDVEFAGDTSILAESVFVPEGVTVRVSSGTLRIWSMGSIDIGGNLQGSSGASPGEPGASIELAGVGEVIIRGSIFAGDGAAGAPDNVVGGANEEATARSGEGGAGESLTIVSATGQILVTSAGRVSAGAGGDGGSASASGGNGNVNPNNPFGDGADATAIAGRGGRGGDLRIFTKNEFIVAARLRNLGSGNGGKGGDASARGGDGAEPVLAFSGLATPVAASGGDSGDISLPTFDLDLLRDRVESPQNLSLLGGGSGGDPGTPSILLEPESSPGTSQFLIAHVCSCAEVGSRKGKDHPPPKGQNGQMPGSRPAAAFQ